MLLEAILLVIFLFTGAITMLAFGNDGKVPEELAKFLGICFLLMLGSGAMLFGTHLFLASTDATHNHAAISK